MHWRPPGWELWEGWGHWPSPPRPFSGPHGTGDAAPEAAGHTHCPLVPARLAGVLEAGKLAVPAGPAVLVNDALLGGRGAAMSGKAGQRAHCVREGQRPLCPPVSASQAQGTGAVSRRTSVPLDPKPCPAGSWCPAPNLHPGRQGPHPLSTPQLLPCRMPRLVHKTASVCSLPAHTQGGEHRPRPHFSAEQMGLMKELMSSRLRRLHRRGWSLSRAGPAD